MQHVNGLLHEQQKALVPTLSMMICTMIIPHIPESVILFSFDIQGCHWSPSQLCLTACLQISPDKPHLSLPSWTVDELLFHTRSSCYWSPQLKLCMTLHSALLNAILFLSLWSTKSSKFLLYDIWSSSLPTIPPTFVSPRRARTGQSGSIQQSLVPREKQTNLFPSQWLSLNTSLHSDNFIYMPLLYLFLSQLLLHLSILVLNHYILSNNVLCAWYQMLGSR